MTQMSDAFCGVHSHRIPPLPVADTKEKIEYLSSPLSTRLPKKGAGYVFVNLYDYYGNWLGFSMKIKYNKCV